LLVVGGQAYAYDHSSLKGTGTCTSTSTNRQLNLSGSISRVADGQGYLPAATPATTSPRTTSTRFVTGLRGTYVVNADGTGWMTTSWSLLPGSTPGHRFETIIRDTPRQFSIPSGKFWAPAATNSDESATCALQ
jgi:hypothetical protein